MRENFIRTWPIASDFYGSIAIDVDQSDFYGSIAIDVDQSLKDVQKYLLVTRDFSKGIQNDINFCVTRDRNNASFRRKLNPIAKNIIRKQNPIELVFEDVSTFDAKII